MFGTPMNFEFVNNDDKPVTVTKVFVNDGIELKQIIESGESFRPTTLKMGETLNLKNDAGVRVVRLTIETDRGAKAWEIR